MANKNVDLDIGRENIKLQQTYISEICHKDYCKIKTSDTIESAIKKMTISKNSEAYLTDSDNKILNKFELPFLLSQRNKKNIVKKISKINYLKLSSTDNILDSIESIYA